MGVHRRGALMAAPVLVVALLTGSACSPKAASTKPFCTTMGDSSQLYSQLTTNGKIDVEAFKAGIAKMEELAPKEVHAQVAYLRRAMSAYFEVGAKRMTVAQFKKQFPSVTIQAKRAEVDEWMRKHCGFGIDG